MRISFKIHCSQLPFRGLLLILKEMPDRTSGSNRCWIRYIWREQDEFAEKIEIERKFYGH